MEEVDYPVSERVFHANVLLLSRTFFSQNQQRQQNKRKEKEKRMDIDHVLLFFPFSLTRHSHSFLHN